METRKRMSEFGLNMQAERKAVCRLSELEYLTSLKYFDDECPCHIYFIGTRPKITVDKDGFKFNDRSFTVRFKAQIEDKFESLELDIENPTHSKDLRFETKFPYFSFKVFDGGREIIHTNAAQLLPTVDSRLLGEFQNHLDFKVLYIGQSYGIDGARTAPDRLRQHSTMQAILEDANRNYPDRDVILALFSFKQWLVMSFDGTMKLTDDENLRDKEHLENVTDNVLNKGMNEQQEINFTEAALIRYFKPEYNDKMKHTFPNPAHTTYSECYDLDINTVGVELVTDEDFNIRFFSDAVERSWMHFAVFNLHSHSDRKGMFDF